ncbi:MAG: LysE family translocator [Alphaproteobacteria bacterium]
MVDLSAWLTFLLASIAIIIVPGPTVTVIIANSMRHGTRAGLLNDAGTQAGLAVMVAVLAVGLSAIVEGMGAAFEILRIAGAAYLIWLGIKLWRSNGKLGAVDTKAPGGSFFWQGVIVIWSNPKALLFFGAFIPQFVDPTGNTVIQTLIFGGTFMAVAAVLDGAYAILAGRTGSLLSRGNIRFVERFSGTCLIGGGLWLALARR